MRLNGARVRTIMPSSRASTIPYVIHAIREIRPNSILDVGVGFGKWGYLFREYTDILQSPDDPARYSKAGWKVRIEGIEGYAPYLHEGHQFAYDKVHVGDARTILPQIGTFDVIFFGDIIEHMPLEEGKKLLRTALAQSNKWVLLTTPKYDTHQQDSCGNPLETHQCVWTPKDFRSVGPCLVVQADLDMYVVAYVSGQGSVRELKKGRDLLRRSWSSRTKRALRRVAHRIKSRLLRTRRRGGNRAVHLGPAREFLRPGVRAARALVHPVACARGIARRESFPGSEKYWQQRYARGGSSGRGSYGALAEFKARIVNQFVREQGVQTVIEYGCGDGNQLRLTVYPSYLGFDVSARAVSLCQTIFANDSRKSFKPMKEYGGQRANLTLSLDVIYHLVEDDVYASYMERLFDSAERYVIIYSSNTDENPQPRPAHVRHRRFTAWVELHRPDWSLLRQVPNEFPCRGDGTQGSFSDFYFYRKMQPGDKAP